MDFVFHLPFIFHTILRGHQQNETNIYEPRKQTTAAFKILDFVCWIGQSTVSFRSLRGCA